MVLNFRPNCLNPVYNETFDLALPVSSVDDPLKQLVLKVYDQDFGHDDLMGSIRLPLPMLEMSGKSVQYTCLILHHSENGHTISSVDAAKLNLKLSEQANQIYQLERKLVSMAKGTFHTGLMMIF